MDALSLVLAGAGEWDMVANSVTGCNRVVFLQLLKIFFSFMWESRISCLRQQRVNFIPSDIIYSFLFGGGPRLFA